MNIRETAITFDCRGETLVGIVSAPEASGNTGVVVTVGGPQYRAGSHRQFTLLARQLAQSGYPTLRFDYRGMGDSSGNPNGFESVAPDIEAAISALMAVESGLQRVVLWGLCDAASASLLYLRASRDTRVRGLCLLNPWVRSEDTYARAQVKHYYRQRLMSPAFWRKLLLGGVNIGDRLREAFDKIRQGFAPVCVCKPHSASEETFQTRMAEAARQFPGPILIILSGNDLTAKEFREFAKSDSSWEGLLGLPKISVVEMGEADHTFSTSIWRERVAASCEAWLRSASAD